VSGLLVRRFAWPLAIMLSADRVPVKNTRSDGAMAQMGCRGLWADWLGCVMRSCSFPTLLCGAWPRPFLNAAMPVSAARPDRVHCGPSSPRRCAQSCWQVRPRRPLSESTLAKMRMTRTGPSFSSLGRAVRYRAADLDAWVASRAARRSRFTWSFTAASGAGTTASSL
jgi:predicted DNA-binding transcriptional regulator AlpA